MTQPTTRINSYNDLDRLVHEVLERAVAVPLAYRDTETDEWVDADGFRAIVNPAWLGTDEDALWYPRTDSYDPANPEAMYGPLLDLLDERGLTAVTGSARQYHRGGEWHIDLWFDGLTVDHPTEDAPIRLGLTTGADHFGHQRLYAQAIAYDPNADVVFRHLTDKRTRRHVKPREHAGGRAAEEVAAWWATELDRLGTVGDALFEAIVDAEAYTFAFDTGHTPSDFYGALGVPDALARAAAKRLPFGGAATSTATTAWDLHIALMRTLRDDYDGKIDGRAMGAHVAVANDILFQPPQVERRVIDVWIDEVTADDDAEPGAVQPLYAKKRSAMDRRDEYRSLRARLKQLLAEAERDEEAVPA